MATTVHIPTPKEYQAKLLGQWSSAWPLAKGKKIDEWLLWELEAAIYWRQLALGATNDLPRQQSYFPVPGGLRLFRNDDLVYVYDEVDHTSAFLRPFSDVLVSWSGGYDADSAHANVSGDYLGSPTYSLDGAPDMMEAHRDDDGNINAVWWLPHVWQGGIITACQKWIADYCNNFVIYRGGGYDGYQGEVQWWVDGVFRRTIPNYNRRRLAADAGLGWDAGSDQIFHRYVRKRLIRKVAVSADIQHVGGDRLVEHITFAASTSYLDGTAVKDGDVAEWIGNIGQIEGQPPVGERDDDGNWHEWPALWVTAVEVSVIETNGDISKLKPGETITQVATGTTAIVDSWASVVSPHHVYVRTIKAGPGGDADGTQAWQAGAAEDGTPGVEFIPTKTPVNWGSIVYKRQSGQWVLQPASARADVMTLVGTYQPYDLITLGTVNQIWRALNWLRWTGNGLAWTNRRRGSAGEVNYHHGEFEASEDPNPFGTIAGHATDDWNSGLDVDAGDGLSPYNKFDFGNYLDDNPAYLDPGVTLHYNGLLSLTAIRARAVTTGVPKGIVPPGDPQFAAMPITPMCRFLVMTGIASDDPNDAIIQVHDEDDPGHGGATQYTFDANGETKAVFRTWKLLDSVSADGASTVWTEAWMGNLTKPHIHEPPTPDPGPFNIQDSIYVGWVVLIAGVVMEWDNPRGAHFMTAAPPTSS